MFSALLLLTPKTLSVTKTYPIDICTRAQALCHIGKEAIDKDISLIGGTLAQSADIMNEI